MSPQAKSHLFVDVSRQVRSGRPYICSSLVLAIIMETRQAGDMGGREPRLSNQKNLSAKGKSASGWVRALPAMELGPALQVHTGMCTGLNPRWFQESDKGSWAVGSRDCSEDEGLWGCSYHWRKHGIFQSIMDRCGHLLFTPLLTMLGALAYGPP